MKSYTDLEQSKKLAEILPIESADMSWAGTGLGKPFPRTIPCKGYPEEICPCWSLAALLDILNDRAYSIDEDANVTLSSYRTVEWWDLSISNSGLETVTKSDLIDACVEMILKLHEQKLI